MANLDILTEDTCELKELAKHLPACARPSYSTIWRWHKRGRRGVKLEGVKVGGIVVSSTQALTRFLEATQG